MSIPGSHHGGNSRFPPWAPSQTTYSHPRLPAAPAVSVAAAKTTSVRTSD